MTCRLQTSERITIGLAAVALPPHLAVPHEPEPLQGAQNRIRRAGYSARRIDILDTHQPPAAVHTRIKITSYGRHQ
jgi:hypothetical protein